MTVLRKTVFLIAVAWSLPIPVIGAAAAQAPGPEETQFAGVDLLTQRDLAHLQDQDLMNSFKCQRRPVLLYFWIPGESKSSANMRPMADLYSKYKTSQLCFLTFPISSFEDLAPPRAVSYSPQSFIPQYAIMALSDALVPPVTGSSEPFVFVLKRNGEVAFSRPMTPSDIPVIERGINSMLNDGSPESKVDMSSSPQSGSAEAEEVSTIEVEALTLLMRKNFAELDARANKYRTGKERRINGGWKLLTFFSGLTKASSENETLWEGRMSLAKEWLAARPDSITGRLLRDRLLLNHAWMARGGGYASQMTPEQRKGFKERLELAQGSIQETDRLARKCPVHFSTMLDLVKDTGGGRKEFDAVFDRAVSLEPEFYQFYFTKAQYLLPKWGGRPGEWEKFIDGLSGRLKGGLALEVYTRTALTLSGEPEYGSGSGLFFKRSWVSWDKMRRGFEEIIRRYPRTEDQLNKFAWFACLAGDAGTARKLFRQMAGRWSPYTWGNAVNYEHWRDWAERTQPSPSSVSPGSRRQRP
ncbi:MAG: hypothetical protein WC728_14045 [Elusimicrobiota bacterium]